MKKIKCYLRGAYGPGNLGDDVLMICAYQSLLKLYSNDDIYIGVEDVNLGKKLLPNANFMHIKKPFRADLVVLGGGGQFFSFSPPPSKSKKISTRLINALQKQSSILDACLRIVLKFWGSYDNLYIAKRVAAYCIGLGPFENGGKNYERTKKILPRLKYISVRDTTSSQFYSDFSGGKEASVFTDPTFNTNLWVESGGPIEPSNDGYISFIVRDWPHDERGQKFIDAMFFAASTLRKNGEKVRFVSLYHERDKHLMSRASDFEWLVWSVGENSPSDFVRGVCQSSKAIVTARAHGVMLPAAFNFPTIAIEIEPKLKQIHRMLPTGTLLVKDPCADKIIASVEQYTKHKERLSKNLSSEYKKLELVSKTAETDLLKWAAC